MKNNLGISCSRMSLSKVSKNMSCSFYLIDTQTTYSKSFASDHRKLYYIRYCDVFKHLCRKIDTSSKIPRVNCRSACNILIPICTYLLMEFYCMKQCFMFSICSGAQARQRK